jgi:hypothetical protein
MPLPERSPHVATCPSSPSSAANHNNRPASVDNTAGGALSEAVESSADELDGSLLASELGSGAASLENDGDVADSEPKLEVLAVDGSVELPESEVSCVEAFGPGEVPSSVGVVESECADSGWVDDGPTSTDDGKLETGAVEEALGEPSDSRDADDSFGTVTLVGDSFSSFATQETLTADAHARAAKGDARRVLDRDCTPTP